MEKIFREKNKEFWHKLFYVTYLVSQKEVNIEYCSTDEMIADYMKKMLVGGKFKLIRNLIMHLIGKHHCIGQKECVVLNI